jgi:hypothetical protein
MKDSLRRCAAKRCGRIEFKHDAADFRVAGASVERRAEEPSLLSITTPLAGLLSSTPAMECFFICLLLISATVQQSFAQRHATNAHGCNFSLVRTPCPAIEA